MKYHIETATLLFTAIMQYKFFLQIGMLLPLPIKHMFKRAGHVCDYATNTLIRAIVYTYQILMNILFTLSI